MKQKGLWSVVWKCAGGPALLVLLLWADRAAAAEDKPDALSAGESTNCTVITSKRLHYDSQRGIAVFEGDVVVIDPGLNIEADQLTVIFAEDKKVTTIEALGNVVITQEDKKGTGRKAVYYVQEGKVVLSGNPRIQRGSDELTGEIITLWRDSGRIVCEPNAVLKLYSTKEIMKGGSKKE